MNSVEVRRWRERRLAKHMHAVSKAPACISWNRKLLAYRLAIKAQSGWAVGGEHVK